MLQYKNNKLFLESIAIEEIAKKIDTPFYLYSKAALINNYNRYRKNFPNAMICFAVKANPNLTILNTLGNLGSGSDCVSEGEIRRSLKAGINPNKIVFSGVGKTKQELKFALESKIFQFNVESTPELIQLNEIAKTMDLIANIAIRVNVNVDGKTHHKITTGLKSNKFGINYEELQEICTILSGLKHVNLQGLSVHIGSQITSLEPYKLAYSKLIEIANSMRLAGHKLDYLDLGGGLGVNYHQDNPPQIEEYADLVYNLFGKLDYKLIIEPGRSIVADIGLLVASVIYIKNTIYKNFVILDAGMNDILRQSLYEAYHDIIPLQISSDSETSYDFVGPICESSDIFLQNKLMQKLKAGDLLAFKHTGAYGSSMSSTYNSRLLIPEIMVDDTKFTIVRKRQNYDEMLTAEECGMNNMKL